MRMRIAELRKARKLTQVQLAADLGWDQGTISRVERGAQNVTLGRLRKLAAYFDVAVPELFEYDGKNPLVRAAYAIPTESAPAVLEVLQIFERQARAQ